MADERAPDQAFTDLDTYEVNDQWLASEEATNAQIIEAMQRWFLERYCDPANETPYSSEIGDFYYVNGGPYDAHEQLMARFEGLVDDDLIQALAEYLVSVVGHDWAPTQLTYYNPDEDVFVDERNEPTVRLEQRLGEINAILGLGGDDSAEITARKLVFASVISCLETFLWETLAYWVENNDVVVKRLMKKHPVFRDKTINIHAILDIGDPIAYARTEIRSHMQTTVWHRWSTVSPLFDHGLGVRLPSVKGFIEPLKIRHDIVHRSGQTVEGVQRQVTEKEIRDLADLVKGFANELDELIAQAKDFEF
ncbi:hypothetical protein [Stenotrophomonas hibiscicola]|uniref:hypothetical protein n=1 Tax=Stenotrophomonas hibiscicola TaxID=86189 RepID=UPI002E7A97B6|nr:hypothetical protein [[Pseudomonas] hibiscicola]